jgi:hypothetical protein
VVGPEKNKIRLKGPMHGMQEVGFNGNEGFKFTQ